MKKSLLALGVLGAFAGAANAQSSVTLYGIVDAGLTYVTNDSGHRKFLQSDGNMQGSRWGLKGTEDLGGGLKAIFVLENGFSVSNGSSGQGGRQFGHEAYVGLSSNTAGTITMGRQQASVTDFVGPFASANQWGTGYSSHVDENDILGGSLRINNSVKYTTADYAGFSASAMYGFSNQTGDDFEGVHPLSETFGFRNNRAWSVGLGYTNGPLSLGAGYMYMNKPNSVSNSGLNKTAGGAISGETSHPLILSNPTDKAETYALGGSYDFGRSAVGLIYSRSAYNYMPEAVMAFSNYEDIELNGKYMLSPSLQLGASYTYTWHKLSMKSHPRTEKSRYHQFNLGLDYFLSKRTDMYLVGMYQKSIGDCFAEVYNLGPADVKDQIGVTAGIRHKF
ncbi:porin [Candidatus Pandoraea novymonadis]|uniref:Outer membrane porin protein n=1 Tax=Candidatus Pandoraea novymonadis TaxID=1808959 RepID=A0ABX5FFB3_9BURK|nr:porin [Candidatus Pandoraea novymonadis]PSB92406.1 Outer membrane porin protein [Candidatus Pandoraea novymonadis]